ncbi:hypothetical protein Fmac_018594 [Flemingia macrophylla]|uniref:Uncharacterized protein n=1 Tax=Flemingia macrophylla TaxID=520843 RepID=A0ABD1M5E5_9FABA
MMPRDDVFARLTTIFIFVIVVLAASKAYNYFHLRRCRSSRIKAVVQANHNAQSAQPDPNSFKRDLCSYKCTLKCMLSKFYDRKKYDQCVDACLAKCPRNEIANDCITSCARGLTKSIDDKIARKEKDEQQYKRQAIKAMKQCEIPTIRGYMVIKGVKTGEKRNQNRILLAEENSQEDLGRNQEGVLPYQFFNPGDDLLEEEHQEKGREHSDTDVTPGIHLGFSCKLWNYVVKCYYD